MPFSLIPFFSSLYLLIFLVSFSLYPLISYLIPHIFFYLISFLIPNIFIVSSYILPINSSICSLYPLFILSNSSYFRCILFRVSTQCNFSLRFVALNFTHWFYFMLRKTIRNEDCALLRNKTKRNIAQKQFFVLLIAFIVINNSQWSLRDFAHKNKRNIAKRLDFELQKVIKTSKNSIYLRNWVFATNSNFLIPKSLQPDGVILWYFKLIDIWSNRIHSLN